MRVKSLVLTIGTLIVAALPVLAHHSFAAEYDANDPMTLRGTVVKFDWVNPHARLYLEVKGPDGKSVQWELEAGNITTLQRRGWKRDTLKPGDEIVVTGYRAKDGSNVGAASTVKTPDGKRFFVGSTTDGSPQPPKEETDSSPKY